jgi:hypothetical protein
MLPRKKQKNSLHTGIWYRVFLGCTFFICLTIGCKETQTPTEEAEIIRQKIVVQKRTNEQPADVERDLKDSGKDKVRDAKVPAKPLTAQESEARQEKKTRQPDTHSETVQKKTIPPVYHESQRPKNQSIVEEGQPKITEPATKKEEQAHERSVYSYNPVGKIDPFRPILSSRGKGVKDIEK